MKNIIKKYSSLVAILMMVIIFSGITCYASENESALTDNDYSVEEIQPVANTAETQTIELYEAKNSEEKSLGKNIAIGLGSGFVIALIVCICIKVSYKNHGHTEPYKYDENAKLTLIDSTDVLVNTHVEKRKIDKD